MTTWPFCIHTPTEVALHFVKLKGSKGTNSSRGRYHATQDSYPYVPCCFWFNNTHTHTNTHEVCGPDGPRFLTLTVFFFFSFGSLKAAFFFWVGPVGPLRWAAFFMHRGALPQRWVFCVRCVCVSKCAYLMCSAQEKRKKQAGADFFSSYPLVKKQTKPNGTWVSVPRVPLFSNRLIEAKIHWMQRDQYNWSTGR